MGLFEGVSFSYVNVADRVPLALGGGQNRTFLSLTKPPLPQVPWNAELEAGEKGKLFALEAQGLGEGRT